MRITFVLPAYQLVPVGGYRVVYEYAGYLASRGDKVTIVFPRSRCVPGMATSSLEPVKKWLWEAKIRLLNRPLVKWHPVHPWVRLAFISDIQDRYMPDADIVVATAWMTARPVADLAPEKGVKFYLIQSHETWLGPEEAVNATWHLPLHRIVIAKWLVDVAHGLGVAEVRHIPNGIDLTRFRVTAPPEARPMSVLTLHHDFAVKGLPDALAVLRAYHDLYPDVPISMFGVAPRDAALPAWIQYFQDPDQDVLVRQIYNTHAVYFGASLAEGWALPPAEAMACGCAFVGTDIGGFRDYASDGDTALLSPAGDRDGLLRNLVRITEDPALLRRIQRRGTENIKQFTWEAAGRAMERYFREKA